jgi:hypothetical protein
VNSRAVDRSRACGPSTVQTKGHVAADGTTLLGPQLPRAEAELSFGPHVAAPPANDLDVAIAELDGSARAAWSAGF